MALSDRHPVILPILLLALGTSLRLFLLGNPSLWLDENFSVVTSSAGLVEVLRNANDTHPPLYYLLLHFWLTLGRSEFMVRLPSAILGALSIPLTYALARLWLSERVALLGALLLTLSPLHIWYSQEARMYSLLAFWGLLSTLSLSLLVKKGRLVWWLVYVVTTLAGLYTHYGMVGLVFAENLWLLAWRRTPHKPELPKLWGSSQVALGLGFLPLVPMFVDNIGSLAGLPIVIYLRLLESSGLLMPVLGVALLVIVVAAVVLGLRLKRTGLAGIPESNTLLGMVLLAFYPLPTIFGAIPVGTSLTRQLVIILPYFFLLVAAGIVRLPKAQNLAVAFLVLLAGASLAASYPVRERENWRAAASLVEAESLAGDVVLFHAGYTRPPFDFYYQGSLPRLEVDTSNYERQLAQLPEQYRRAWVVLSHESLVDRDLRVRRWLDREWDLVQNRELAGITVRLYRLPSTPASYAAVGRRCESETATVD